jgi:hypothetical protein
VHKRKRTIQYGIKKNIMDREKKHKIGVAYTERYVNLSLHEKTRHA